MENANMSCVKAKLNPTAILIKRKWVRTVHMPHAQDLQNGSGWEPWEDWLVLGLGCWLGLDLVVS